MARARAPDDDGTERSPDVLIITVYILYRHTYDVVSFSIRETRRRSFPQARAARDSAAFDDTTIRPFGYWVHRSVDREADARRFSNGKTTKIKKFQK